MAKKGVALILGGSKGIGQGVAESLATQGYDISLIARTQQGLEIVANNCARSGANTLTFAIDVTNTNDLKRAIEETNAKLGSIDVLICAVGQPEFAPLGMLTIEEHDKILDTNYRAIFHAVYYATPYMGRKYNRGAIIFFSSFLIFQLGFPGFASYVGAKTALNGLAKSVFEEVRSRGIKVSNIYVNMVNSPSGNKINKFMGPFNNIKQEECIQIPDVVRTVNFVINASDTCCTCEIVLRSQVQPFRELALYRDNRPFQPPAYPKIVPNRQVALITGASKGIGKVIAERLAQRGYDLALVARTESALNETAALCAKYNRRIIVLPADLNNMDQLENVVVKCVEQLGNVNVLINNAGVNRRRSALAASAEIWDSIIDTNFRSALHITRATLPFMAQNTTGARAVIYIGSAVVLQAGRAGVAPYYATKHAINGFIGGLYEDVRPLGIKVSSVCPGLVNTELGTKKGPVENFPPELLIQCSDCADAVEYVLDSSETVCPTLMYIHPQAGVSLALAGMRTHCEKDFLERRGQSKL